MAAAYVLKTAKNGQFYFNLKAGNGEVILTSEMYKQKESAMKGIESCRVNAATDAQFSRQTSTKDEPYFTLKAANGEKLGRSEMYSSTSAMEKGIASVAKNAPDAQVKDQTEEEA